MNLRFLILFVFSLLLSACSFNSLYYQPDHIPHGVRKLTAKSATDTVVVLVDTITLQPTFVKTNGDTILDSFTIESVVFKSVNGNKLNGWILKDKMVTPKVTLIHFHGNGGSMYSHLSALSPLLKFGYQVFMFDYSGYGFSEGKPSRNNILQDANAAVTYVKNRRDLNLSRVVIYGQSLGGHLSAVVAEQRQNDIDALVMEGAFSSHKDIAANSAGFFGRLFVVEKYSAYKSLEKFHKPVLIIHSSEDDIIPVKLGRKNFEHANEPKSFYEIRHCHICGPQYYADSIAYKINSMLF